MIFEFDEFELDTGRFELRHRGEPCHVEPQVFDVLRLLVERRDQVVAKEQLLDGVWGDRFVSESALTSRIKMARQAVGDNGRAQRVIGTVHGRGYRFLAPVVVHDGAVETPAIRRDVRYAHSDSVNIAYEVTGEGSIDIVLVPGFVSHLELDWEDPRSAEFLERLGREARLIRFDKRGTGLSDRPPELPDLETRMDDVRAVMDAAGSERAVVFGYSEGGPMAALFAATYPARTRGLVLYGSYAKRIRSDENPWAPTFEERRVRAAATVSEWGIASNLVTMCPNADAAMAAWWQRRARAAASPGTVCALIEMNSQIDVRDVLPTIHVPCLVLHRIDDRQVPIEDSRYLASQIPEARLVELPGVDHVPWIDTDQVLEPIEAFVRDVGDEPAPVPTRDRALATVMITDIVGSADLNASMGDARWSALLDRHDRIMREIVDTWRGRWVRSTGDGALAVFETPARALRAAVAAREQLGLLGIRIRTGVQTSEIEWRDDDVAGLGVTVAARLVARADPGEILATATVRELVSGSGIELAARGEQEFKGLPGRWQIAAVAAPEPRIQHFDAGPARSASPKHVPQSVDPFMGRNHDLTRVANAVDRSRLVTLSGPGGVGKTRLAIEHATEGDRETWFVDLSRVSAADAVAPAFLDTLGVTPRTDVAACDRLIEALEARSILLVVDNCEHLLDAAGEIVNRVTRETRDVRVLATSRQPFGVTGEQVVVVAPLGLPPEHGSVAEQRDADAVRMFTERAERAGGSVDDLDSVVTLCRRLDGIPLALELAAARTRAFSPAQLLEQLDAGWSVAVPRRDQGPAHHLSLDDTIDWSYRLLDEGEQSLLLVLGVLRGPFDLGAASAVAGRDPLTTADQLAQLVDRSLLQTADGRAGRRFRLLETVRTFTAARVDDATVTAARDRHAEHFADRVDELGARIPGPDEDDAGANLAVELDDVHAAYEHAASRGDIDVAARLAAGPRLSLTNEGARWAHLALRAIDLPGIEAQPAYVSLVASAAWAGVLTADLPRARALAERGLEVVGDAAEHPRLCWIWPQATGRSFAQGAAGCVAGAAVAASNGDPEAESFLLGTAAIYGLAAGDDDVAIEAAQRALTLGRQVGSRTLRARAAGALAYILQEIDPNAARLAANEVLDVAPPGDFHLNMAHRVLAVLAWRAGDREEAAAQAGRAAALIRDQGDRYVQGASIRQLANLISAVDLELAAVLLGVADGLVPEVRVIARDERADAELRALLVERLGRAEFEGLRDHGAQKDTRAVYLTIDDAIACMRAGRAF